MEHLPLVCLLKLNFIMTIKQNLIPVLMLFIALFVFSCDEDEMVTMPQEEDKKGKISLEITDAPIDDSSVKGVFVTVTEVKIDGETYEGFEGKKTIDLMAYQNGDVEALGTGDIDAQSYSSITLVLDYETDANGDAPGCYVLMADDTREDINATAESKGEITFEGEEYEVEEGETKDIVIDFDLRKSIKREANNAGKYEFVTTAELSNAVRYVEKEETGTVEGNMDKNVFFSDKVIVYAYKKGTYSDSEMEGQGASSVDFSNAVSSSVVAENGDFELHFLEEGDYELHYVGYEENGEGQFDIEGKLLVNLLGNISFNDVSISARTSTELNISIVGLLPL